MLVRTRANKYTENVDNYWLRKRLTMLRESQRVEFVYLWASEYERGKIDGFYGADSSKAGAHYARGYESGQQLLAEISALR